VYHQLISTTEVVVTAKRKQDLPVDVYIPFVETLFRDGFTLAIGISAQAALIVSGISTNETKLG